MVDSRAPMVASLRASASASASALSRRCRTTARAAQAASTAAAAAAALVPPPPAEYDFRADIGPDTRRIVAATYPELTDLVDSGALVVHARPSDYSERRHAEGYVEPELVFLVGTAHVSERSAEDVARVISAVRPECVVVELCRSRAAALGDGGDGGGDGGGGGDGNGDDSSGGEDGGRARSSSHASAGPRPAPNPLGLSGARSFAEAMAQTLEKGGQSGLVLRLLLAAQARAAAARLGVEPGAEFRAAAAAADAAGAQLVLGDRPVEISLSRAWGALSWPRRAALLADLARGAMAPPQELSRELVERLKDDGAVGAMFEAMSSSYPELVGPLVSERDLYLAWSLKRSKAVCGAKRVVGVVGRGHMRGVVYALRRDRGTLRFADLVGPRGGKGGAAEGGRRGRREAALRRLALDLLLGAGMYAGWVALTTIQ